jgi:CubicO group peptidase (beta-lactamase class C family)
MRVAYLCSLTALAAGLAVAQSDLTAALDEIASAELSRQKIPGAAAAVVKDSHIVWSAGLGVTSMEGMTPVTPETLFRLGSARVFLAAAAVQLSSEGRIRLEAPAGDYLFGLDQKESGLSTRNLLSAPSEAAEEAVAERLISSIRSRPAPALLDEMIFAPLGMTHTTFAPSLAMTYPLALGHTADRKISRPMAGNTLFTSARDLAQFLMAYLNDGKLGDRQALAPAVIGALSTDSGYGLDSDAARGVRLVRQTSTAPGYTAAILMAPDFHTGVVVLTNRDGASAITVAQKLLERSLPVRFPLSVAIVR